MQASLVSPFWPAAHRVEEAILMAWVVSIREIKHVEVFVEEDRRYDTGRIPGVSHSKREETFLPSDCWGRLLEPHADLPVHRGAGPCGTITRRTMQERPRAGLERLVAECTSSLTWSLTHLVEPLRAFYATYVPPLQFGAKQGPRGRRAA